MLLKNRIALLLGQVTILVIAFYVTKLLAPLWFPVVFFVIDGFSEGRYIAVGSVLLVSCIAYFLCILCARSANPIINLASRGVLLVLVVIAAIFSREGLFVGSLGAAQGNAESYSLLAIGVILSAFVAGGIKIAFCLNVSFWLLLIIAIAILFVWAWGGFLWSIT